MSKKRRKNALKFILGNSIILTKITDALGCDKKMTNKERKVLVKDMIETYAEENFTDSFNVNMFGPGKKPGFFNGSPSYRNDDYDEDWGVERPKTAPKRPRSIDDLLLK